MKKTTLQKIIIISIFIAEFSYGGYKFYSKQVAKQVEKEAALKSHEDLKKVLEAIKDGSEIEGLEIVFE